ncbi:MAG: class I SAM-dependent methyltransferase [Methanomassiliicoccales archaeon]|nr:class I SAM-dependent methyltransferase [Methanomassiliicoccales archaeon]
MTLNIEQLMEINKTRWNEKVEANQKSPVYDVQGFLFGKSSLLPIEVREVGDVRGKDLLHLQCHFGMDTLSWARRGARVTGVDFSPEAIKKARELSEEVSVHAEFIESNIYDLVSNLQGQFDVVFTSYGVICWLPDLKGWARIISRYLRPGGFFYMVESHPFGSLIDENCPDFFKAGYPYFSKDALLFEDDVPIIDSGHEFKNKKRYEWMHPISEIINALVDEGLRVDFLHEFPYCFFPMHPAMELREDGYWYLPEKNFNVPMLFSLKATKM